jgi:hypothetical protein
MVQKLKGFSLTLITLITAIAPLGMTLALSPMSASAACDSNIASNIDSGASQASGDPVTGCDSTDVGTNSIGTIAANIVKVFSIIVGAVSVIMIIYGGFRYITSGGASDKVGNAKNTLIYAIIGLIIVAIAQLIVHFVLNQANTVTSGSSVSSS